MNIVVLHGQMHKGSTYNITKLFLDKLSTDSTEIKEFFLPADGPTFCVGCFNCFVKGEDKCPHASTVQPIAKAIEESDLVILDSPCYVYGMSGQLKTFLDHMGYRWMPHRPHPKMFGKVGLVISTAAGAGTKQVNKTLKNNLFFWGVPRIYNYGKTVGALSWQTVKPEKKLAIEKEVTKLASKISKHICNTKPGIKTKFMFRIMRLNQKSNDWNPVDKNHWGDNGWLSKSNPW
ncbi:MAG: flavodoxin family protein [Clostridiales bacterium]|jgi:multimeric flavodoxin WrbA|nr:flavodoxin family protein [Clostridiales bacterium]